MDWIAALKNSPHEAKTVRGYKIWEPYTGWPLDFGDMIVEMLRRGYEITLVPQIGTGNTLLFGAADPTANS